MAKKNKDQFVSGIANDRGPAGNTASKTNAIATPTIQQQTGPGSLREQIRAAGADGNLGKNELLKISESTGKGTDRIIRSLDKVNSNRASDRQAPIGLGNAAYNSLLNTRTNNGTMFGKSMDQLGLGTGKYADYGTGAIGQAILQGKGSYNYDTGSFSQGTGKIPKGQQVFGSYNGTPQLQIKPQWNGNDGLTGPSGGNNGGTNGGGTGGNAGGGNGGEDINQATNVPTQPEMTPDPIAVSGGTGSSVDGGATSFRRKKSSGRSSGLTTRGTGQFRNSLKVGSASGVNIGM